MFRTKTEIKPRRFYYVRRFQSPLGGMDDVNVGEWLAGYGGEYMGSTEFELGGFQESAKAMAKAKRLTTRTVKIDGVSVSMLYIEAEGDPTLDLLKWHEGEERADGSMRRCAGKENSRFDTILAKLKKGEARDDYDRTVMWWSHGVREASENVIFGFTDEPHFSSFVAWMNVERANEGKKPIAVAA